MKHIEEVKKIALDLQNWATQVPGMSITIFEALTIAVEIQRNILLKKDYHEEKPDLTYRTNIDLNADLIDRNSIDINIDLICAKHISQKLDELIMNITCKDDI